MSMKQNDVITIVLLYGLAYFYSLQFAPKLAQWAPDSPWNRFHESCIQSASPSQSFLLATRGSQYILDDPGKSDTLNSCLMTFWGATHAVLYIFLGFFAPRSFWLTFGIGVAFEIYEKIRFDCADALDILWNSVGFLIGRWIAGGCVFTKTFQ